MEHRASRHHLGVKQRAARQQTMKEPAMTIGPIHHGCNGEPPGRLIVHSSEIIVHFQMFSDCFIPRYGGHL